MIDETKSLSVLEGLLFISGDEGISLDKASEVLELEKSKVNELFCLIEERYKSEEHGIELVCYGGIYRFVSKEFVYPYANKLLQNERYAKLSSAAMETLAIIAYKQPITRVEIEEIRGVGVDMMLKKLVGRGLIAEVGRSDAPGKPLLYGVTETFMDAFSLVSLDELPSLPDFSSEQDSDIFERKQDA